MAREAWFYTAKALAGGTIYWSFLYGWGDRDRATLYEDRCAAIVPAGGTWLALWKHE